MIYRGYGNCPRRHRGGKKKTSILGIHAAGHDASAAMVCGGRIKHVIEFERVAREKRYRVFPGSQRFNRMVDWIFDYSSSEPPPEAIALQLTRFAEDLFPEAEARLRAHAPHADIVLLNHHLCHASAAYFTSPFTEAAVLSIDGWGNEGATLGFHARGNKLSYVKLWPYSLGLSYRALGAIIGGIHAEDLETAGKTMGLTSYGEVISAWKPAIAQFLRTYRPRRDVIAGWEPALADGAFHLDGFGPITGANTFGGPTSSAGQDFAATFQACWTELVLELAVELARLTKTRFLCLSGGAALNAVANFGLTRLSEFDDVHFIPNPNDAGLSLGAALYYHYAYQDSEWSGCETPFDPFLGPPVLDQERVPELARLRGAERLHDEASDLAQLLADGQIIGVIEGRAEIGPRALGARSILADPRLSSTRERINHRIKHREWYRPLAPVIRQPDVSKYFEASQPSPYMSLVAPVRKEWRATLQAVTHVDGSARYQTVTADQNPFLWQLLTEFEKRTDGIAVLLNTSLNGPSEPIVASLHEALHLLDHSALDGIYCQGWLFRRGKSR